MTKGEFNKRVVKANQDLCKRVKGEQHRKKVKKGVIKDSWQSSDKSLKVKIREEGIEVSIKTKGHIERSNFDNPHDADEALYYMNHFRYMGVELEVEIARSTRKTPHAMRSKDRGGSPYYNSSRYDDDDYYRGRRRERSYSRSPKRHYSRSRSPYRRRSYSRSRSRSAHHRYGESSRRRMSSSRSLSATDQK